ncbi:type II toxin-antitoxin system VapC family toxin [Sphingomonas sp.]|uniref:type II toxin-antitoxin system VapC family toxin n=1 Tax=Sphingomonas sp. TaxID=28214 RepID=UPI0035BC06BF
MTLFVDASALVAIVQNEDDADILTQRLAADPDRVTSALALWEAARAIRRDRTSEVDETMGELERFCRGFGMRVVTIGIAEATGAMHAQARYGKGTGHPARLNMGDCFAYACAKTNTAKLLYKGDDFVHTDLA